MESMNCPTCGGRCRFEYGKGYVCSNCGNIYDSTGATESAEDKLNIANKKRIEDYDFEGALELCLEVLEDDPDSLEANWCALLAEYKIVYLRNDRDKYVPSFLDPDMDRPMYKSDYYAKLNITYRNMADEIEKMRALVVRESRDIPDYDVFISYRQHVRRGSAEETEESAWAEEFYNILSRQTGSDKLRVFYDKRSLEESNAGWEPHIYAALRSAKFLVLMGSSLENINSTWVKNEWKRFIAYRNMGKEKTIAVLGKNIDPARLPDVELRAGQMINADERGWQDKLFKRANAACKENKDCGYLLSEADTFICKNKFKKAKKNYLKVCSLEPRNSKAYWGLLRCKLKAFDDYDIVKSRKKLVKINEFNDACRYATGSEKKRYEEVRDAQLTHNTNGFDRTNYKEYRRKSKAARFFKKVGVLALIVAVAAFGFYSYLGISQPVTYNTESGATVVTGKSIYFNLFTDDLEIDTHNGASVVGIESGALAGAKMKTVTLKESVRSVGEGAFLGCTKLETVYIENDSVRIGKDAFKNCSALKTVVIGSGANKTAGKARAAVSAVDIGDGAFSGCSALETFTVGRCAKVGAGSFSGCTRLKSLKLDITDSAGVASTSFDGLGQNVEIALPSVAEDLISTLKAKYSDITFSTFTRDAVEECIYFIDKLSAVSGSSAAAMEKAEALYAALSASEKQNVTNYETLQNARAVRSVAEAIDAIGTVTLNSEEAIGVARDAYNKLTAEQKKMVANYETLTTATAVYDVMKNIAAIGKVDVGSEHYIEVAEEGYNQLTPQQKDMVSNSDVLTEARAQVDKLIASSVEEQIRGIGSVIHADSAAAITAAETRYNALTSQQKSLVSNYLTLSDARKVYDVVSAITGIGSLTASSGEALESAEEMYNALSNTQKPSVGNHDDLLNMQAAYPVVVAINNIGKVTESSSSAISQAESAYARLTVAQKPFVANYDTLTDSRAVYDIVRQIDSIDRIASNNIEAFKQAQSAYNALSATQKSVVGNYDRLLNAEKAYEVFDAIEKIGNVTKESDAAVKSAETAYGYLTAAQKEMVSNYATLTAARDSVDRLFAADVISLVNAFPVSITLRSESAVMNAYSKYNSLTESQKYKVTNRSELLSAVGVLNVMKRDTTLSYTNAGPWTVHDAYGKWNAGGAGYISNNYQIKVDISSFVKRYVKESTMNIKVTIELTAWEVDDGYQEVYVYNKGVTTSQAQSSIKPLAGCQFEHSPGKKNTSPATYVFTAVVSPDAITQNELWIVFDSWGDNDDDWKCKDLVFKLDATTDAEAETTYKKK